jgi:hypothetical protein
MQVSVTARRGDALELGRTGARIKLPPRKANHSPGHLWSSDELSSLDFIALRQSHRQGTQARRGGRIR